MNVTIMHTLNVLVSLINREDFKWGPVPMHLSLTHSYPWVCGRCYLLWVYIWCPFYLPCPCWSQEGLHLAPQRDGPTDPRPFPISAPELPCMGPLGCDCLCQSAAGPVYLSGGSTSMDWTEDGENLKTSHLPGTCTDSFSFLLFPKHTASISVAFPFYKVL